jgi:hypothetical protein
MEKLQFSTSINAPKEKFGSPFGKMQTIASGPAFSVQLLTPRLTGKKAAKYFFWMARAQAWLPG